MIKKVLIFAAAIFLIVCSAAFSLTINYEDALLKAVQWFDANKCGNDVKLDNVFSSWRGPCHTQDGSAEGLDLTGGFHDAGDHVKFGLPQCWSASVLGWALYEYRSTFDSAGITTKMLSTLKYFTDYFLKSHPNTGVFFYHVGDGGADHGYWGAPENQTGARPCISAPPGADVCGEAAAALTLMYLNYNGTDSTYAARCLTAAKEIYKIGYDNPSRSSDGGGGAYYKSSSHYDDLAWGAIWLSIATGDQSYLAEVDEWFDVPNDPGDDHYQKKWAPAWDDVVLFAMLKMAQLTWDQKYIDGVVWNLTWYRDTLTRTPYGLPWLDSWGVLRYGSSESGMGYLAYKLLWLDTFVNMGNTIMDYCLGRNPRSSSYLTNYAPSGPQHPHHRANEPVQGGSTHGMVGALVGGPGSDDSYVDSVTDYTHNEVAIDYNAAFILGLAGRAFFASGGEPNPTEVPTPTPEPTPTPVPVLGDVKLQYRCNQPLDPSTELRFSCQINNGSSSGIDLANLKIRYFYKKEGKAAEECHIDYAFIGEANLTGTNATGYAEIGFVPAAGTLASGGTTSEIQVRINKTDWSSYTQSNDYSFGPTISAWEDYILMALYNGSTLIWGTDPVEPGTTPDTTPDPTPDVTVAPTTATTADPPPAGTAVQPVTLGDVNSSGTIDIVDALLVAQYYVGLPVSGFDTQAADVTQDGTIDIIDALRIAQFYVGLIPEF